MESAGIFGPKRSGKTTLAKAISREYWFSQKRPSLVFDPHVEKWGEQAWVSSDEEKFWPVIWQRRDCLVIVEEAAATIRRERDLVPVFTRLRHQNHKLIVIGHDGTDLLPVMRRQFDVIYLFLQTKQSVEIWRQELPACPGLEDATRLGRFEFLRSEAFGSTQKRKLIM